MIPLDLDARRLLCPMPVIRLQQIISHLNHLDQVRLRATDPGVLHDIPAWCRIHGHKVLETAEDEQEIIFLVQVQRDST